MLKPLHELFDADPKQKLRRVFQLRGHERPQSVEQLHQLLQAIDVHAGVPRDVWQHFQTARNLALYGWFVAGFAPAAELHAYGCVELALRIRVDGKLGKRPTLNQLLAHSLREGWLNDHEFRRGRVRLAEWDASAEERRSIEEVGVRFEPLDQDPQYYARIVCDTVPFFRNHMAHGRSHSTPSALSTLEVCAEIINQLFAVDAEGA